MDSQFYAIYAGTDLGNMTLLCSSEYNPGISMPTIDKELNSAGSFTFTMAPDHPYVDSIKRYLTIVDVYLRGTIVFRGRVFDLSSNFYKELNVSCEGNLSWFSDNYRPKANDEVIENTKPFNSIIRNRVSAYNADMEAYKNFRVGVTEPPSYIGNLIDGDTVMDDMKIDTSDGETLLNSPGWLCETGYIPYESGETYVLYVGSYDTVVGSTNTFCLYGEENLYLGYVVTNELTDERIEAAGITVSNVASIRVSGARVSSPDISQATEVYVTSGTWYVREKPSSKAKAIGTVKAKQTYPYVNTTNNGWVEIIFNKRHGYVIKTRLEIRYPTQQSDIPVIDDDIDLKDYLFWLTTKDEEVEADASNTWGGGSWGDYLRKWLNDTHHLVIRARVVNNENVLDVLNPRRKASPVSEFVLGDNLIDITTESEKFEAYSYICPTFDGESYPSEFPPVEIPNAVAVYGKIYREIEFGEKPKTKAKKKLYRNRLNTLLSIYDPTIANRFVVKGLDKRLVFDNTDFTIIDVGDTVRVKSPYHLGKTVDLICLSLKIDVFNLQNSQYQIGQYIDDQQDTRIKTLTESFTRKK